MENPADYGIPSQEWGPCAITASGYVAAVERRQLACGLDPANLVDFCGVAIVESIESPEVDAQGQPVLDINQRQKLLPARYEVRSLRRLPRGVGYLAIVAEVGRLIAHPEMRGAVLCVDAGGLGGVVVDLIQAAGIAPNLIAVTTTGSVTGKETRSPDGTGLCVGKQQLVANLQTLLQTGRLLIPRDLPESKTFLEELKSYSLTLSASGHPSYGASTGHDDLVSAASLAVFALYPKKMGAWTTESLEL